MGKKLQYENLRAQADAKTTAVSTTMEDEINMVFYDNLGKPESEENLTEKARAEREKLKKNLKKTLEDQNFTPREIDEIIKIIDNTEVEIQKIKDDLIGTNLNNEDPSDALKVVEIARIKIHNMEIKMGQDIKNKVAQIRAGK